MTIHIRLLAVVTLVLSPGFVVHGQHSAMPSGMTHDQHLAQMAKDAEMKARGAQAMGFDQDAATHHFRLLADGGEISVGVSRAADEVTRTQIQAHLKEIAVAFREGDFDKPFSTHGEVPPGVVTMQQLQSALTYAYVETETGGAVRIVAANPEALAAVHAFLTYQITEHSTGDPLTVQKG